MIENLLIARVGGERIAMPATEIQAVIELGAVVPAPCAPPFITGLATQRSRTLTVFDVALALGLPRAAEAPRFALVLEIDGVGYALAVDTVENVIAATGEVQPIKTELSPGWANSAAGTIDTVIGTVLLLDLAKLVSSELQEKAA